MKTTILALSLLVCFQALSQKKEIEFGKISKQEMNMTSYDKDKDAKAVVLFDKGQSIFFEKDNGYDIRFTRHKRIKIFNKSESQYAEISLPIYKDGYGKTEIVKSIQAVTYNIKNGIITQKRLDPATIYEEQINERWFNKKFVFPDVQDGSILEFKYVLETPFHFNLPDWTFQDRIPTIYSEYEVGMIPFYEYVFRAQGIAKFDFQSSVIAKQKRTWGLVNKIEFQDYIHTYVLKDIPAFKDETYITSINDYIIKMNFQLAKFHRPDGGTSQIISTWPALNQALLKHDNFGKYLKSCSRFTKDILNEMNLTSLDNLEKSKRIIEYVKSNFEWNGFNGKYSTQTPKDFVTKKIGNSADINLFLIALLNEAGIEAQPLILSTRNHGKMRTNYPFDHFTNYVLAYVKIDYPFLADGTEELLPFNKIPTKCYNNLGLLVSKEDQPQWIGLKNNFSSIENNTIIMVLDTLNFDVKAEVSIANTDYEAFFSKKKFENDTIKIKEFYADKLGEITSIKTAGYKNVKQPYLMKFNTIYETEKLNEIILIKPFLNLPLSKNNLTQDERSYPVDFVYPWENAFECTMVVPKGFLLTDLPEGYSMDNDLAHINLTYTYNNNLLIVKGNYKFKKAVYVANEYSKIKDYFNQIIKFFNQPITITKAI